jgi:hypothetical protein
MTGGIMPKLFAMRWPIAISVLLLLLAGTIGFATTLSSRPTSNTAVRDDYVGERQQLLFFKAALGRIDDELRHRGGAATPSLRGEREAVLRRMREVASRVPAERLPPEVAALLLPAPAPAAVEATARPRERSLPVVEVRELQTGLGAKPADIDFSSLALDRPPPLPVFLERPARERPARERERAAAEKPAREQPSADRAAKERAPAQRATARPPVTVERTAIAVQSEARQPAR